MCNVIIMLILALNCFVLRFKGMGGSKTDPGIFINWSLRLGTTASTCITFDKFWPISRDLVFDIRTLELWVVNEVITKKTNFTKRDFYSTVVMWNRLGKHKANVKERDYRITEHRDCCFHNGASNFRHSTNCSPAEVHETEQRHFEPSHTSITGTNTLDDELLIAIKNRLAGVPPMPGALSLKPERSGERFIMHYQESNRPQPYLETSEPSKPKKVPTPVATQVDDSMITELKHLGTSTSHAKVKSTFTQSPDGAFPRRTEDTAQMQHSSSRMKRDDEGYQRSSQLEQNTRTPELRHYSSRMNRVDEGFQRTLHLQQNMHTYSPERTLSNMNQMDQQHSFPNQRRPSSPSRAAFPNHPRPNMQSQVAYPNHQRPSVQSQVAYPNQLRPNVQSQVEPNEGLQIQPHLPEVPHYYPLSGEPSISRSMRSGTVAESSMHQKINELSRTDMQKNTAVLPYQQQLVQQHASDALLTPYNSKIEVEVQVKNTPCNTKGRPSGCSYEDTLSQGMNQTCDCGSRELNLACFCNDNSRDCGCDIDDTLSQKKRAYKEAKAEQKRRKKEEKRRKKAERDRIKREKKEQKARERECIKECRKRNRQNKKNKKSKSKKMCSCCKCNARNSPEVITNVASENCISQCTDGSKSKKKYKKEKTPRMKKERKTKEKKKKNSKDFGPCRKRENYNSSCRMSVIQNPRTGVHRCCSHPESPCPALANREMARFPVASSKDNCGDSKCPNVQITAHRSCTCYQLRTINDRNCQRGDSGCITRVCALPAQIDLPPHLYSASPNRITSTPPRAFSPTRSTSANGNSPSLRSSSSRANTGDARVDAMRYRDISAAPAIIMPNEIGRGDEAFQFTGRWQSNQRFSSAPADNALIDLSKSAREGSTNKRYVPPCVLYLDCTKVKDLCVIIKDKYEDPS